MVIKILLIILGIAIFLSVILFLFLFVAGSDESRKGMNFEDENLHDKNNIDEENKR